MHDQHAEMGLLIASQAIAVFQKVPIVFDILAILNREWLKYPEMSCDPLLDILPNDCDST